VLNSELEAAWEEHPFYGGKRTDDRISLLVDLTQQVYNLVERELKLTGFWESVPARNKLKAELQKVLLSERFIKLPGIAKNRAQIISRLIELSERNNDIILYAG
jgi:type I restriction enzyme, R subunit